MPQITVVTMVRNEAGRYLRSALAAWGEIGNILAYDDKSDDETVELLRDAGATIIHRNNVLPAWGNEWEARRALWNAALTMQTDWLLWLDADMIPARDPNELCARDVDAIAFRLFDLWNWQEPQLMFRLDGHWQAHEHPRVWMIRKPHQLTGWEWNERGIHCGHMPLNYRPSRTLVAPQEYSLLHYGYARELDRWAKAQQYSCQSRQLDAQEYLHALSITDAAIVGRLPVHPQWRLAHYTDQCESRSAPLSDRTLSSGTVTCGVYGPWSLPSGLN